MGFMVSLADTIQIGIFCALIFYTWETRKLRKWQQKQVQLTILNMELDRRGNDALIPSYYPKVVLEIYRDGCFDPNEMFTSIHRLPPRNWTRVEKWLKSIFKK
jgi:hypothetical protein